MTVVTRQGRYQGLGNKGVTEYRGVPFARAPLGNFRFKAPQPLPDSDAQQTADHYPMPSLQMKNPNCLMPKKKKLSIIEEVF